MESIGRLAGGIAHDFNNELTVINGYSRFVLSKLGAEDPLRATIEEIAKAGERSAALTRQLLAFSRKQMQHPRVLDLNRVEEMRPVLERLVGEDVELGFATGAGSCIVRADRRQLEQAVMNLAVNARDAMPGGGRLRIEVMGVELDDSYAQSHPHVWPGHYAMLAVSDDGAGMDEATRLRIFEPFFTTKPAGQGTGLGLSMVEGIVAQSGGHIEVFSEPARGSTFKIYLPAVKEAPTSEEKQADLPAMGGSETVLVVEDLAEVRDYAVAALKAYGYTVFQAGSASEALAICQGEQGRIHLVVTDVAMPDLDGRELAKRLLELSPGIKVLFMSGYTNDVIPLDGALDEEINFIEKPFAPEELARKVRTVLARPTQLKRILVADDDGGVRGFMRAVLERSGYEVTEAADGKQAVEGARAGQVDLVITDLIMPEQEGLETIQALRRLAPGVALIAMSGAFEGRFLEVAQKLGAHAALSKPVSEESLLAVVTTALETLMCRV